MRIAPLLTLVAALAVSSSFVPAEAAEAAALDALTDAVQARQSTVDGSTRKGRRLYKALVAAEGHLVQDSDSIGDDLRSFSRCVKLLEKRFRDDAEFQPLYGQALADMRVVTDGDRDRLAATAETIDDKRGHIRLTQAVAAYDRKTLKADRAARVSAQAAKVRAGWKKLAKVEKKLGLGPEPDFRLIDTNPSSSEFGRTVSPRDYLGKISAYYFGHST